MRAHGMKLPRRAKPVSRTSSSTPIQRHPQTKSLSRPEPLGFGGGEFNAYTSKEDTWIYAAFSEQHLERAVELIADITFNATFPVNEIKKERDVILDELNAVPRQSGGFHF